MDQIRIILLAALLAMLVACGGETTTPEAPINETSTAPIITEPPSVLIEELEDAVETDEQSPPASSSKETTTAVIVEPGEGTPENGEGTPENGEEPTWTPTPIPIATSTSPDPTPTASPSTPSPSSVSVTPTATSSPVPTATPTTEPLLTITPAPEPEPTAEPISTPVPTETPEPSALLPLDDVLSRLQLPDPPLGQRCELTPSYDRLSDGYLELWQQTCAAVDELEDEWAIEENQRTRPTLHWMRHEGDPFTPVQEIFDRIGELDVVESSRSGRVSVRFVKETGDQGRFYLRSTRREDDFRATDPDEWEYRGRTLALQNDGDWSISGSGGFAWKLRGPYTLGGWALIGNLDDASICHPSRQEQHSCREHPEYFGSTDISSAALYGSFINQGELKEIGFGDALDVAINHIERFEWAFGVLPDHPSFMSWVD